MARITDTEPEQALERATDKMLAIIKSHLSSLSPRKQRKKWDALERSFKDAPSGTHAKR